MGTRGSLIVGGALLLLAGVAACQPAPARSTADSFSTADLTAGLMAAGVDMQEAGPIDQEFFGVPGQIVRVGDVDAQVFEYPEAAARQAESDSISSDGTTVGTTMVTWVARPVFWARGRLIVLTVGADRETIALLSEILGEPIARGPDLGN